MTGLRSFLEENEVEAQDAQGIYIDHINSLACIGHLDFPFLTRYASYRANQNSRHDMSVLSALADFAFKSRTKDFRDRISAVLC